MLTGLVTFILVALGLTIGAAIGQPLIGLGIAVFLAFIQIMVLWTAGSSLALLDAGATRIEHSDNPMLFNVVEEMSIAAGQPMPKVYVIESDSMNAFATGMSPDKSAIAVTRGLLNHLNRYELQGVVAHEMSHIRNSDTRMMITVAVMVGSIVMLSDLFLRGFLRAGFRGRGGGGKKGGAEAIILIAALVFALLALIIAPMLQFAVSRKRELLADASAVELTRYPSALANALKKLTYENTPFKEAGKAFQHFYIVNPARPVSGGGGLYSTHPPIEERIRRLQEMALEYPEPEQEKRK